MTRLNINEVAVSFTYRLPKTVTKADLNNRKTLYAGRLLSWIDEDCFLYCSCQMQTPSIVVRYISPMNFLAPVYEGDEIEIGVDTVKVGKASLTVRCVARHKETRKTIIQIDEMVFVSVDTEEKPIPHARSFEKKSRKEKIKADADTLIRRALSF